MGTKKPIETIRHGSIKAAIWENEGRKGPFLTVTLARVYRDGDDLKDTKSFGLYDLWPLVRVAAEAYAFLAAHKRENDSQSEAA